MVNPFNAGINAVTNCINGLKNVISSQKKWWDDIFLEKFRTNSHTSPCENRDEMVKFN